MSDSLWPHELQHARPPCPSPASGVHSNSRPSSWWCHLAIILCHPLFLLSPVSPSIRVFSSESTLHMRWLTYWSFSHNWVLFLLWLHPFILSEVISPLTSSSILGTWGVPLSVSYHFAFSYCSWGSQGKNTEVVCHSLLQWITICQISPPWPARLELPRGHGLVSLN